MNLDDLHIFTQTAKWKNITKTAAHVNRTQSNVTARIKLLEEHFKAQLFYRHKYGVTLTPSGKMLLSYAEKIIQNIHDAETVLTDSDHPAGPLTIGSMETTAATRLPDILSSYHLNYPEVELSLTTGTTTQLTEAVLDREIEGAFIAGTWDHPDLIGVEVWKEDLVVIGKDLDTKALQSPTIIVFQSGCFYRETFESWLHAEGIRAGHRMELNTLDGILGCVRAGLGISLLTKTAVLAAADTDSLQTMELPPAFSPVPTFFLYHKESVPTPAFKAFLNYLQKIPPC